MKLNIVQGTGPKSAHPNTAQPKMSTAPRQRNLVKKFFDFH